MEIQKQKTKDSLLNIKTNIQISGAVMQMALLLPTIFESPSSIMDMPFDIIADKVKDIRFTVHNDTDNIPCSMCDLDFLGALKFVTDFPKRYEQQGYYRDNNWNKLNPLNVRLIIKPLS